MIEPQLNDALNDCIDRLADGQSINDCLAAYPEFTHELRQLLEIGRASSLNRADTKELAQMHLRLDPQIETLIAETKFTTSRFRLPQGLTVLAASLVLVFIGILIVFSGNNNPTGGGLAETITPEIITEISATFLPTTITSTDTQTRAAPPTETVTITETATAILTTDTNTPTKTLTVRSGISQTPDCPVPEGWLAYHVQAEDSLSLIAFNSGTSIESLREANCLGESNLIIIGDKIYVPHLWDTSNTGTDIQDNSGENDNSEQGSNENNNDDHDDDHSDDHDSKDRDDND